MWTDNETEIDFLNFNGIAKTVATMIRQVQPKPVSIGVSGAWGVGKSSLIKFIRNELMLDKSTLLAAMRKRIFPAICRRCLSGLA
jgi:putative protein kinase ArgK-like GTPase of G3E family